MIFFLFMFLALLKGTVSSSHVDFSLVETPLYPVYTSTVKIGYPPQNFSLIIDTGSEISWVPCRTCYMDCINDTIHRYDTNFSSTKTVVSCPQNFCDCSNNQTCRFDITYKDQSSSSGYFVQDSLLLESNNFEARINFGCNTFEYGSFEDNQRGFDGILGFGRGPYSLPYQLRLNAFSYCFNKDAHNGYLLFGEAIYPNLTFTPMIPSMSYYALYLEKIMVGRQILPIEPSIFRPSKNGVGTFIDSGTAYFLLIEEAYDQVFTAIKSFLPITTIHKMEENFDCFILSSSTIEAFPVVTLIFSQNVTLVLKPNQYLRKFSSNTGDTSTSTWCLGIVRWKGKTILGGFIFQNKLIVYDLARERVGWANFDCSISNKELPVDLHFITRYNNLAHQPNVRYKDITYIVLLIFVILFLG